MNLPKMNVLAKNLPKSDEFSSAGTILG